MLYSSILPSHGGDSSKLFGITIYLDHFRNCTRLTWYEKKLNIIAIKRKNYKKEMRQRNRGNDTEKERKRKRMTQRKKEKDTQKE